MEFKVGDKFKHQKFKITFEVFYVSPKGHVLITEVDNSTGKEKNRAFSLLRVKSLVDSGVLIPISEEPKEDIEADIEPISDLTNTLEHVPKKAEVKPDRKIEFHGWDPSSELVRNKKVKFHPDRFKTPERKPALTLPPVKSFENKLGLAGFINPRYWTDD